MRHFFFLGLRREAACSSGVIQGPGVKDARLGPTYPVGSSAVVIELFVQFVFGDLVGRDASRGTDPGGQAIVSRAPSIAQLR